MLSVLSNLSLNPDYLRQPISLVVRLPSIRLQSDIFHQPLGDSPLPCHLTHQTEEKEQT